MAAPAWDELSTVPPAPSWDELSSAPPSTPAQALKWDSLLTAPPEMGTVEESEGKIIPIGQDVTDAPPVGNLDKPLINLPQGLGKKYALDPISGAVFDTTMETVEGLTTPKNLAITAGLGALGKAAQAAGALGTLARTGFRAASAYFAKEGAVATTDAVKNAVKVTEDPNSTVEEMAKAWTDTVPAAAMAAGGALGTVFAPKAKTSGSKALETAPIEALPEPVAPDAPPLPVPAPKQPSIVTQIDSVNTKGSPTQVNAAINDALIKSTEDSVAASLPEPIDYAKEQNRVRLPAKIDETQIRNENAGKALGSAPAEVDYAAEQNRIKPSEPAIEHLNPEGVPPPKPKTAKEIHAIPADEFLAYIKEVEQAGGHLTQEAHRVGLEATGKPAATKRLEALRDESKAIFQKTMDALKAEKDPVKSAALYEEMMIEGQRSGFFGEAVAAAKNEGSYAQGKIMEAREAANRMPEPEDVPSALPEPTTTTPDAIQVESPIPVPVEAQAGVSQGVLPRPEVALEQVAKPRKGQKATLAQDELALQAQDPETFAYLQEQRELGKRRPAAIGQEEVAQGMTEAEYVSAVKKASSSLAAKPTPEPVSTPKAFEPEVVAGGGEPPGPPTRITSGAYEDPIGPKNTTPEALGIEQDIYRQGLTKIPILGEYVFEPIKKYGGIVRQNISAVDKRLGGVVTSSEFERTQGHHQLMKEGEPLWQLARKSFTPHGVELFGELLMNSDIPGAKAFAAKHSSKGAEFAKAIDQSRKALDRAHELQQKARGEDIGQLPDYFPRKVRDFKGLHEYLTQTDPGIAEAALAKEAKARGRALTIEEQGIVLSNLIRDSKLNRAKPGYLKERTIDYLDANTRKFYEPFDVAMENHFRKVVDDYVERRYFGKEPGSYTRGDGIFGEVFLDQLNKGNLSPKAQDIIVKNLRDRFALNQAASEAAYKASEAIRTGTAAAYLGQISVALNQFGDAINTAFHTDPLTAIKGYGKSIADIKGKRSMLDDISVDLGNPDTAKYAGSSNWATQGAKHISHIGVGLSDAFNKNASLHSFAMKFADIIEAQRKAEAKNPKAITKAYDRLRERYAQKFPDRWQKMFEDIGNRDFEKGAKMSNDAQLMLFNELADFQPLNKSEMAQGYNAAGPIGKTAYVLKSFWLKQLGTMRERGYERIKNPRTRADGIAYLAAYTAVVAMGSNMLFQYLRDKLAGKDFEASNAAVGGLLQMGGLSRYTVGQVAEGHLGDAALGFVSPLAGVAKEAGHDAGLVRDVLSDARDRSGRKLVRDTEDFAKQSQLVRHLPIVGTPAYNRLGAGKTKIDEDKRKEAVGKGKKTILESVGDFFNPPAKKTDRK